MWLNQFGHSPAFPRDVNALAAMGVNQGIPAASAGANAPQFQVSSDAAFANIFHFLMTPLDQSEMVGSTNNPNATSSDADSGDSFKAPSQGSAQSPLNTDGRIRSVNTLAAMGANRKMLGTSAGATAPQFQASSDAVFANISTVPMAPLDPPETTDSANDPNAGSFGADSGDPSKTASQGDTRSPLTTSGLIRSMLGEESPVGDTAFSDGPLQKRQKSASNGLAAPVSAEIAPLVLMPPVLEPSEAPAANSNRGLAGVISVTQEDGNTTGTQSPMVATPQFALAFGARLTQLNGNSSKSVSEPVSKAGSDDASPAPNASLTQKTTGIGTSGAKAKTFDPSQDEAPPRETCATSSAGSSLNHAGDPPGTFASASGFRQNEAAPLPGKIVDTTPFHNVSEALRTTEPASLAPPQASGGTAPGIVVRIAQPEAPPVDLQVTQRAGEVHVSVRTPDAGLQSSLRQELGTLVNSLERAGYHAETFTPQEIALNSAAAQANLTGDRRDSQQDSPQDSSRRGGSGDSHRGQQHQQRHHGQRRGMWQEELEKLS